MVKICYNMNMLVFPLGYALHSYFSSGTPSTSPLACQSHLWYNYIGSRIGFTKTTCEKSRPSPRPGLFLLEVYVEVDYIFCPVIIIQPLHVDFFDCSEYSPPPRLGRIRAIIYDCADSGRRLFLTLFTATRVM